MKLTLNNPLRGKVSPYSPEGDAIFVHVGELLALLYRQNVTTAEQAFMALHLLRNHAAGKNELDSAFAYDRIAASLLDVMNTNAPQPPKKARKAHDLKLVQPKKPRAT